MKQDEKTINNNQIALNEIEHAIERLSSFKSKTWWKQLNEEQLKILGSLFGRIATVSENLENKKEPDINNPIKSFLNPLVNWCLGPVAKISSASDLLNIKKIEEISNRLENTKSDTKISKPKENDTKKNINESNLNLTKRFTALEVKIDNMNKIATEHYLLNKEINANEKLKFELLTNTIKSIYTTVGTQSKVIENLINENTISNKESTQVLSQNLVSLKNQYDEFQNEITNKLSKKINIRDAVEILEIREDVEKFVTSDLIKKVSVAIIPAIEALKDARPEDIPKALLDLESRCSSVGLISMERLYS